MRYVARRRVAGGVRNGAARRQGCSTTLGLALYCYIERCDEGLLTEVSAAGGDTP
jgi:hypothetical protein